MKDANWRGSFEEFTKEERMYQRPLLSRNPRIKFGNTCVRGTGITTAAIEGRWLGGETVPDIADDYGLEQVQVVAAIYFELGRRERWSEEARGTLDPDEPVEPPRLEEFEPKEEE